MRDDVDFARVAMRGAERWVRRGHPWIYRSDVIEGPASPGVISVRDERGAPIGMALWSPTSQIAVRMLTRAQHTIDYDFWRARIEAAWAYRQSLGIRGNAFRVVHGEADGIPSLVVDAYEQHLVIQVLSAGLETQRDSIVRALIDVTGTPGILARNDVAVRDHEHLPRNIELLHGTVPREIIVDENGVHYLAAPWTGQKTGAFIDQRDNRIRVGELARGRALDCFSYHGSFALHLAQKAEHVTAVDASGDALIRARENVKLNPSVEGSKIDFVEADAFEWLRAQESAGERYDTIVLDPPAFAKRRDAIAGAVRGYKEINLRAMKLLSPGGHLCTFSCSFHISRQHFYEMLESAAADSGRAVRLIEMRGQAHDHPDILQIPESTYLKGAILQVL